MKTKSKKAKASAPVVAPKEHKTVFVYVTCKKCGHRNGPIKPASLLRSRSTPAIAKAAALNGKKGGRPRADGKPPGSVAANVET